MNLWKQQQRKCFFIPHRKKRMSHIRIWSVLIWFSSLWNRKQKHMPMASLGKTEIYTAELPWLIGSSAWSSLVVQDIIELAESMHFKHEKYQPTCMWCFDKIYIYTKVWRKRQMKLGTYREKAGTGGVNQEMGSIQAKKSLIHWDTTAVFAVTYFGQNSWKK